MKTILVDAVYTFVSDEGVIFQEMFDLLEKYSNKKIILTNASHDKFEQYSLNKMPYEVFTLEHNPDKIDPKYFELMSAYFGFDAKDVIYFENNEDAVKSAESVGIKTYHYDKDKKDLSNLKMFLDDNLNQSNSQQ
ncbi:MAG: hypothetical protein UT50_C0004G0033 [Candidatus Moranbacteria bacterium GW2011_GWA2_39_41]|nr:MAG: hypothetical protein UT50_C0004G0033 [Candidatus Moranbacteria bacterium GW2011_GWA2_39_41]